MPYCTYNDLVKRFGQREIDDLLDRDYDNNQDSQTLDLTLTDADNLIHGYLGVRYRLPISDSQALAIVTPIACDIVRFMLWDDNAPKEIQKRYDTAITLLENYRDLILYLPNTIPAKQNPTGGVDYFSRKRVFDECGLKGF